MNKIKDLIYYTSVVYIIHYIFSSSFIEEINTSYTNLITIGIIPYIMSNLVFWTLSILFSYNDLKKEKTYLLKYKIQENKNRPLLISTIYEALPLVILNVVFINFILLVGLSYYYEYSSISKHSFLESLPYYLCAIGIEEILFYYIHRLLHWGIFYKYIHKIHHRYTAPIGFVTFYAHPIEHILTNMFPTIFVMYILKAPINILQTWTCMAILTATISHCGYHYPFSPSAESHDYHHYGFNNNFGVTGILDMLHGTDKKFRSTGLQKRNTVLFSSKSAKELYPNDKE